MATITGCNSAAIPQRVCQRNFGIEHGRVWLIGSAVGTLFRASQFLSEELPIRLAHRVEELADLPDGLNEMPSIKRVQEWYAQSFEVRRKVSRYSWVWRLTPAGNHNTPKAQSDRRGQRTSVKTYQKSKSRKGLERDL